ncbi:MAG: hypothetical protein V4471_05525 [Pseudomonadota bacterium]
MKVQHPHSINELLDSSLITLEIQTQELLKCAAYAEGGIGFYILLNNADKVRKELLKIKEMSISVDDLNSVKSLVKLHQFIEKTHQNLHFSSYERFIKPKILAHAKIEVQLDILKEKAQSLTERNCPSAASAAQQIITDLHTLNNRYFIKEEIKDAEYKVKALEIIGKNKSILEEHRDYNYIIANIILAILTVGTAPLIHKVKYGNFLFFTQTDSIQKIAPLKQLITEQDGMQSSLCIKKVSSIA